MVGVQDEIVPKNLLMIGPTGCGKTEIARRLAKLADAPFIKVEATKFTEVGYHGRDVDSIVRDLVENSIQLVKSQRRQLHKEQVRRGLPAPQMRQPSSVLRAIAGGRRGFPCVVSGSACWEGSDALPLARLAT